MASKKIRVTNHTTDTGIRARIIHFQAQVQLTLDVPQGAQSPIQPNVATGDRGVIIYEDLNEEVIATSHFVLDQNGLNVDLIITGSAGAYDLSFAAFP
jgi:hypothetical protein